MLMVCRNRKVGRCAMGKFGGSRGIWGNLGEFGDDKGGGRDLGELEYD